MSFNDLYAGEDVPAKSGSYIGSRGYRGSRPSLDQVAAFTETWSTYMDMHKTPLRIACAALLAAAVVMPPALASAEAAPAKRPAISMSKARAIALKVYPGKIMKEELEHERGGSGLRYSFDLRRGKHWREVGVDAMTGRVLENAREGANPKD